MSSFFSITPVVHRYLLEHSLREHPLLEELRAEIAPRNIPDMCLLPEAAQLLALLVSLTGARRILEIGTFIGYSSLTMAMALPRNEGHIITCDTSKPWTDIAKTYWERAEVQDKIEYYEKALSLLRTGGLLVIDNVLRQGTVCDPLVTDRGTEVTRELNQRIFQDERVMISLVPIADGLFLVQKK